MSDLKEHIRALAEKHGSVAFGIADLDELAKTEPDLFENFEKTYPRAVVMGVRLQETVVEEIKDQPTTLYFHHYRQANYQLDRMAWYVADLLQAQGHEAAAIPSSQYIKRDPMRGHISHRKLAMQAGLGFRGRSSLLVHPEHGARMRYITVLTNAPLEPDQPYDGEGCGNCRACISVCPASAIKEDSADYDQQACFDKLCEFTRISFIGQHICGVCVKACTAEARLNSGS